MKTYKVKCGGAVHRIGMEIKDLSLYALDHDLESEEVAAQLGADKPACLEIIDELDRSPNEAMSWAIEVGQTDLIPIALAMGADASYNLDWPLKFAAMMGHADTVELLLSLGTDPEAERGLALRWAASNGHLDVVKILAQHSTFNRMRNQARASVQEALNDAMRHGHQEVSDYLYEWLEEHPPA